MRFFSTISMRFIQEINEKIIRPYENSTIFRVCFRELIELFLKTGKAGKVRKNAERCMDCTC